MQYLMQDRDHSPGVQFAGRAAEVRMFVLVF